MLPTEKQLRAASHALADAIHYAFAADLFLHQEGKAEILFESSIQAFKVGVAQLGFDLVQRVAPPCPSGGRMDMEADADA